MKIQVMLSIFTIVTSSLFLYSCRERTAEDYFKKAMKLADSCENICEEVIQNLDKAIELNPNYAEAYYQRAFHLADCYSCDDQIIADYSKAIEINPQYIQAYLERAFRSGRIGNYDQAIADYTKVIELQPDHPHIVRIYYDRGTSYFNEKAYDNAINGFTKAVEIAPDFLESYALLSWILATCPDAKFRNGTQAVTLAQTLVRNRENSESLIILAAAYAEAGDFSQAILTQERALLSLSNEENTEKFAKAKKQLETYKAHQAWRE